MEYKRMILLLLTIEDMGIDGEGIGKVDGYTVFVKDTVIGDKVTGKDHQGEEKLWLCQTGGDHGAVERPESSRAVNTPVSVADARSRHFLMKNSLYLNK